MRSLTAAGACLLGLAPGVAACGGQPAVCDDMDALRASAKDLQNVEVGNNALATLSTDLQKIQTDLNQLSKDASEQYSSQVAAVKKQTSGLTSSLQTAAANPSAASFTEVSNDVNAVGSAVSDLGSALTSTCN